MKIAAMLMIVIHSLFIDAMVTPDNIPAMLINNLLMLTMYIVTSIIMSQRREIIPVMQSPVQAPAQSPVHNASHTDV